MDLAQSIEITRPPADVYAFVATEHATNHPRWDPAISDMRQETPAKEMGRTQLRIKEMVDSS